MTERADLTIGFDSADSRTWPPNAESWFQVSYTHEAIRNYTDKFSTYADLITGQQDEVSPKLEEHQDCIIFHKTFHFAIYHQVSTVRWKIANHIAEHFQAPLSLFPSGH